MSTLDEITKEKQRVGEALVRVDAQREQLVSQLRELEATERVLARYTKGAQARKTSSAKMPTKVTAPSAPARLRGRRRTTTAIPAGGGRGSSNLSDQVLALATGKPQQEIAATADHVAFPHLRPTRHQLFEGRQHRLLLAVEADNREHRDFPAELLRIGVGVITANDARLFERPHAAQARRRGHARQTGKGDVGDASVFL